MIDRDRRMLVTELRRLRARTGLSYVRLGRRTGYSRSSWERFLNGKQLPPRSAVEALARLAGADPAPAVRYRELAKGPRTSPVVVRRPAPAPPHGSDTRPAASRTRSTLTSWPVLLSAILCVTATVTVHAAPGLVTRLIPAPAGHRAAAGGPPEARCRADEAVLYAAWIGHARVQVLHSRTCQAVWARGERLLEGDVLAVVNGGTRADTAGLPTASSRDSPALPVAAGDVVGACLDQLRPAVAGRTCTSAVRVPAPRP
ncbi:helix-turn-helix domain-containing protein [Streptomyces lavendulae]|uniref:helix-turn-helix domain-containing protein n=1 Tax=Streptomyces lavendulae TaxID=1914 RepID=UPI00368F1E15